jgi:hypothetical protein
VLFIAYEHSYLLTVPVVNYNYLHSFALRQAAKHFINEILFMANQVISNTPSGPDYWF